MDVGKEMEIFITLTKYNIHQWCEEGKPLLMFSQHIYLTIVFNIFMRNGTYPLMFIGRLCNNFEGTHGMTVIIGIGFCYPSSNPTFRLFIVHIVLIPLGKVYVQLFFLQL